MFVELTLNRKYSSIVIIIFSVIVSMINALPGHGTNVTALTETGKDTANLFPEWSADFILSDTLVVSSSRLSRSGDRCLAYDASTGNYYAVFSSLVYTDDSGCIVSFCRSTDGGHTFEKTYDFPDVCPMVDGWDTVVACNSGVIGVAFAARTGIIQWDQRVYISTDGGITFKKVYDANEWYELGPCIAIDEDHNLHLTFTFVEAAGPIRYYRSTDLGEHWELHDDFVRAELSTLARWEDELYIAYSKSGVWTDTLKFVYSFDNGTSWSEPQILYTCGNHGRYMSMTSDGEGGLYIAWMTSNEEGEQKDRLRVFRSLDGGRKWMGGNVLAMAPGLSRGTISADGSKVGVAMTLHQSEVDPSWFTWNLYFCGSTDRGLTWGKITRVNSFMAKSYAPFPHLVLAEGRGLVIFAEGLPTGKSCVEPIVSSLADPSDPNYVRFSWDEFSLDYKYSNVYALRGESIDLPFHAANYTSNAMEVDLWGEVFYQGKAIEFFNIEDVTLLPGEEISREVSDCFVPSNMIPGTYTVTGFIGDHGTTEPWDKDQFSIWVE